MDLYPIKFRLNTPSVVAIVLVSLALNMALLMVWAFLLAYAASKGWAAAA